MRRLTWTVLVAMALSGCKPRVGGNCTYGQATCADDGATGLFCGDEGRLVEVSCRGKGGCQRFGARVWCDQSLASEGEACTKPGFACTTDRGHALACKNGSFSMAATCSGPGACKVTVFDRLVPGGSGGILCDNDVASAGDPCLDEGDVACTQDRTTGLRCSAKTMVSLGPCRGPKGCAVVHGPGKTELACDAEDDSRDDDAYP